MSILFRRPRFEQRAITGVPWDVGALSETTSEARATGLTAVYASTRLLADTIATLPVHGFRKMGPDRIPMGNLPTLFALMSESGPGATGEGSGTMVPWLTQMVVSLVLRGNAVGWCADYDGQGHPIVIKWLSMDDVYCDDTDAGPAWYVRGRSVPTDRIFHIPWIQRPGQTLAMSPIEVYADTINAGLKAQEFGARWFDNGGVPPGTFRNDQQVVPHDEAEVISRRLTHAIRKGRPLVYGSDWTYTPVSVPPDHVQFIESQKLSATQVAAIYGIPPERVGGETGNSKTYANVEQDAIDFVTLSLRPWLVRIESKVSSILPERQVVKFNADALVRADIKSRYEVHKIAREIEVHSVNDIRRLEDEPPIPGGDTYKAPTVKAQPAPTAVAPAQAPPVPSDDEDDEGDRAARLIHIHRYGGSQ